MSTTDVLIIGAGPTGLTLANVLAQSGVSFRIVERDAGPVTESRALLVQSRTLELFDKLGFAGEATARGQLVDGVSVMVNGTPRGEIPVSGNEDITPYSRPLVLEQSKTQRLLLEALEQHGGSVEWSTVFRSLTQHDDGVTALLEHANGDQEQVYARYLVAADGARSRVRDAVGLHLEGSTYDHAFFLADLDVDWPHGHDKLYLNVSKDFFFAFFPMEGSTRHFRLIGTLTPELSARGDVTLAEAQAIVSQSGVHATFSNPRWLTVYRIHKRMARHFQAERVFLIGDAAHIHSPAGGQGMNTGIGDAFNLGWKLAAVLKGHTPLEFLASYEAERLPVAQYILAVSDRNFDIEVSDNPFMKHFRLILVPLAAKLLARFPAGRTFFFDLLSQFGISYRESPIVAQHALRAGTLHAGDRAPYGIVQTEQGQASTLDLLRGVEHQLFLFEGQEGYVEMQALHQQAQAITERFAVPMALHRIMRHDRELHQRYGMTQPGLCLIRPDGYIAYYSQSIDLRHFEAYLDNLYLHTNADIQPTANMQAIKHPPRARKQRNL